MAACLMILLYVRYEMSYDTWIPDADRVYQIQSWYKLSETGEEAQLQITPYAAGAAIKQDFPPIARAHVCTPVTNAHLVCRLLLDNKNTYTSTLPYTPITINLMTSY